MRTSLNSGTIIEVPGSVRYQIGLPVGEGGCSIVYAAKKYIPTANGEYTESPLDYAIKECFPLAEGLDIYRDENGSIVAGNDASEQQLALIKAMQQNEADVTGHVFNVGFRTTPILETYDNVSIISENGEIKATSNLISILGSLSEKGQSLKSLLASSEAKKLTAEQVFRIGEQLLYAVDEVHKAGYLHLDIQDGNVFLHGSLEDRNNMISLLDFGTAKELSKNNTCEVNPREVYSTQGFTAPEILLCEDETLRLGCQADVYSVGALMLYLLTGQKTSSRILIDNKSGSFIPKFAIQSTKCPKHLVDRMQTIVAKSLNVDVEKRYSSALEMLDDVSDFLEAIAPYRNPLTSNKYDAFICYKHNKLDNMAATTLRDSLERFKARSLDVNDKQKIETVFVDEGELSSCADFGERINDALKNSEWLIVICSNETKESRWVNEEIRTFLKYHDRSHILAVITEGEPDDVYPLELKKNGLDASTLFAADARADGDVNRTRRLIKTDVRLRIAASMLGITYDNLKQRRNTYILIRRLVISATLLIVLAAFGGYALYKNIQLRHENEKTLMSNKSYYEMSAVYDFENKSYDDAISDAQLAVEYANKLNDFSSDGVYILSRALDLYNPEEGYVRPISINKNDLPEDAVSYVDNSQTGLGEKEKRVVNKIKAKGYDNIKDIDKIVAIKWMSDNEHAVVLLPHKIFVYYAGTDSITHINQYIENCVDIPLFKSGSVIMEISKTTFLIITEDAAVLCYARGVEEGCHLEIMDVIRSAGIYYSMSEDAFYIEDERNEASIFKFNRYLSNEIYEISRVNYRDKLTNTDNEDLNEETENIQFHDYEVFETSDAVYYSNHSIPLMKYDKASNTTYRLLDSKFRTILVCDACVFGLEGKNKIVRYDTEKGNVREIIQAEGKIMYFTIMDKSIYYCEIIDDLKSEKGYSYKYYETNIDGKNRKTIDEKLFDYPDPLGGYSNSNQFYLGSYSYEYDHNTKEYLDCPYFSTRGSIFPLEEYGHTFISEY